MRLEPAAPQSRVKHSTTELLRSLSALWGQIGGNSTAILPHPKGHEKKVVECSCQIIQQE